MSPLWDRLPNDDLQLRVLLCVSVDVEDNVADDAGDPFGSVVLWLTSGFIRADVYG